MVAATAKAMARLPHQHVMKYRSSLATLLATVVAAPAADNPETAFVMSNSHTVFEILGVYE